MKKGVDTTTGQDDAKARRILPPGDAPMPDLAGDAESVPLEAMNRLKLMICGTCGTVFALPLAVFIDRMHTEGNVYCVCGHINHIDWENPENQAELTVVAAQLLVELTNSRHTEASLRCEIARLPIAPALPMTEGEMERRMNMLAATAKRTGESKLICRFCGNSRRDKPHFKAHLKEKHREEISGLPAAYFD